MLNLVYYFSSVERGFSSRLTENNRMTVGCRWRRWCRRCKQAGCRKRGETKEVDESRCQETTDGIWFALFVVDWYIRRTHSTALCRTKPIYIWWTVAQPGVWQIITATNHFVDRYCTVFTARCYASAVLAMALCLSVRLYVCPSVRLSITSRSSTKTAKRRITQTAPHDTPGTLVSWRQRSPRNSTGVTPYGGAKCRWGGSKSATFDK